MEPLIIGLGGLFNGIIQLLLWVGMIWSALVLGFAVGLMGGVPVGFFFFRFHFRKQYAKLAAMETAAFGLAGKEKPDA